MNTRTPDTGRVIAIAIGDPAGVGPEIALKAAADPAVRAMCSPVLVGHRSVLARVAKKLGLAVPERIDEPPVAFDAAAVEPGKIQACCGTAAAAYVDQAIQGCRDGRYAAMVTCPINK